MRSPLSTTQRLFTELNLHQSPREVTRLFTALGSCLRFPFAVSSSLLCLFPIASGVFWAALDPSALWQALYQRNKASLVLWETEVILCLEAAQAYYRLSGRIRGWEKRTCQLSLDKPMSVKDMPHAISITEITRSPWEAGISARSQACRKLFRPET